MTTFEQSILVLRCLFHMGTFLILMCYSDPGAKSKPRVSVLAIGLAFVSGSLGMRALFTLSHSSYMTGNQLVDNLLLLIFAIILFAFAVASRGNVARMLPRS